MGSDEPKRPTIAVDLWSGKKLWLGTFTLGDGPPDQRVKLAVIPRSSEQQGFGFYSEDYPLELQHLRGDEAKEVLQSDPASMALMNTTVKVAAGMQEDAAFVSGMAWSLVTRFASDDPAIDPGVSLAVRRVLSMRARGASGDNPEPIAQAVLDSGELRDQFDRQVFEGVRVVAATIQQQHLAAPVENISFFDDGNGKFMAWDAILAAYLDSISDSSDSSDKMGRDLAQKVRDEGRARWAEVAGNAAQQQIPNVAPPGAGTLWRGWIDLAYPYKLEDEDDDDAWGCPIPCPFAVRIAAALWADVVRPELERKQLAESRVGAARQTTLDFLLPALRPAAAIADDNGRQVVVTQGDPVGWFDPLVLDSLTANKALARLRSAAGLHLLCLGAEEVAHQLVMNPGQPRAAMVTVLPAKRTLARQLGLKVGELDELLSAGRAYRAKLSDGRTLDGMFMAGTVRPGPGRAASTVLTWNAVLFAVKKGSWLTPLPDPTSRPRFGGRVAQRMGLAWLLVHRDQSKHAMELAKRKAAPVDWGNIADTAELSRKQVAQFQEILLSGQGEIGPWILEPMPGLFRLADDRRHNFLVGQGLRRARATKGGKTRAATARREDGKFAKKHGWKK